MKGISSLVAESRTFQHVAHHADPNKKVEIVGDIALATQALDTEILEDGFTLPKK